MDQEFEAPPMSGDNLPLKELRPEEEAATPERKISRVEKKLPKQYLIMGLVMVIFSLFLGLGIGLMIKRQKKVVVLPSPSPSQPSFPLAASPLPAAENLEEKINSFKKDLDSVDLKESVLTPPELNFNIRFELKD